MSFALYWQRASFLKSITILMNHIAGQCLNYLEFQLLMQQGNILFQNKDEQNRQPNIQNINSTNASTSLDQDITHKTAIVVKLKRSKDELIHSSNHCFLFWKQKMAERYGAVHSWFQSLCQQRDIRRVSIQRFLSHIQRVLKDTIHKNCSKRISLSFQKSKKNQIQLSVFMNVILIQNKSRLSQSISMRQRTYSAVTTNKTKKDERYQDMFSSQSRDWRRDVSIADSIQSKLGYESLRELAPKKSFYNKYLTPKFKIKKSCSNYLNQ